MEKSSIQNFKKGPLKILEIEKCLISNIILNGKNSLSTKTRVSLVATSIQYCAVSSSQYDKGVRVGSSSKTKTIPIHRSDDCILKKYKLISDKLLTLTREFKSARLLNSDKFTKQLYSMFQQ